MSGASKIEWTEATWNPLTGCTLVSEGCRNCYAARETAGRLSHHPAYSGLAVKKGGRPVFTGEIRLHEDRLDQPLRWRKPRRVFVNSMSDLFHPDVPDAFIAEVFGVMAVAGQPFACGKEVQVKRQHPYPHTLIKLATSAMYGPHTFQILTKRPARAARLLASRAFRSSVARSAYRWAHNRTDKGHLEHQIDMKEAPTRCYKPGRNWPLRNVWLGTSVEDQKTADDRIPHLLATPAAVRFLSCEPLLGPVDLRQAHMAPTRLPRVDWVIVGGESGPNARPMHPDWARSLVEQCQAAGVPAFVKQLGDAWGRQHKDIDAFPTGVRVREYPEEPHA